MSAFVITLADSRTMLRRNLRRLQRYPSMTLLLIGMPIVFLLLFVYVFGGQLGNGLGRDLSGGRFGQAGYLNYVTPGILLITVAAAVQGTAIVVAIWAAILLWSRPWLARFRYGPFEWLWRSLSRGRLQPMRGAAI